MKKLLLIFLAGLISLPVNAQQKQPLRLVETIPLPNIKGRIDHFGIDLSGRRLFMSALGDDLVEVFDLTGDRVLYSITGLREPQGVTFVPDSNRIFVANGGDGTVRIFEGSTYQQIGVERFSSDADDTRYDASTKRLYVGYGEGGIGILDGMTGKVLGQIRVKGHPEAFEVEKGGRRIYVNVPTAHEITVADARRFGIIARWRLRDFQENFPMGLDPARHRLFVATRQPAQLIVFDTVSGELVAHIDIGGDADDLWYDARRQRIYISCGEGFVTVVRQRDADHYAFLARVATSSGARTSFYSPELNRLYVGAPRRTGRSARLLIYSVSGE